ncbi:GMC oxidoreductase [Mesorhizobium sp.]|uniref:GMC oxidoreductase n=1 Tax=Mesorhizobium sp. TaxID=1871066 RepID=UPI00257AB3C4|nr:GMC family oxidoreductase [Mesorhizobium sp.]
MIRDTYDAVVIGTGAGGACVAYQLCQVGMKVLALEKGPRIELDAIVEGGVFGKGFHSQGRGDELKYTRERFLQRNVSKEIRFMRYSEPGEPENPPERPTSDGWMSQLVGGGTVHYGGASFRPDPVDTRMRSMLGSASNVPGLAPQYQAALEDWPVDFNEYLPWFEEAERLIGIAGAPASGLPPLPFNKAEMRVASALKAAKDRAQVTPTPMAINSADHGGRDSCHHSGLCQDYACRFEAKSDMRVTLLREAEKTGNLTIQPDVFVRKLIGTNSRITELECVIGDPEGDAELQTIKAPIIIVACEIVESIRLLLNSGYGDPNLLGRYVMYHVTGGARSIAPTPTTTWDNAPHTAYIRTFYNDADAGSRPFIKTGILLFSTYGGPLQAMAGKIDGRYLWGEQALTFFDEVYPFKMDISYIGEGMPTAYNRVELKKDTLDRYRMPATVITYRPHPFDLNAAAYIENECVRILKLAGGVTQDIAPSHLAPFLGKSATARRMFHGTGGCRFGTDPKTSVLDRDCRVHGMDNLYVADGSFMPTGLGVNPTLTIQANALRVGRAIADRFAAAGASPVLQAAE